MAIHTCTVELVGGPNDGEQHAIPVPDDPQDWMYVGILHPLTADGAWQHSYYRVQGGTARGQYVGDEEPNDD